MIRPSDSFLIAGLRLIETPIEEGKIKSSGVLGGTSRHSE